MPSRIVIDVAMAQGIDPEVALRLAGFLVGIVGDERLMREAQVNIAIRGFAGFGLTDTLPDYSSLSRTRQRWGADRFRAMFVRTVQACMAAGIASGEVVHMYATSIRADVSWESLGMRHADATMDQGDRPDLARKLIRLRYPRKMPVVRSPDEAGRLIAATTCLKHQTALSVASGAVLRART